MLPAMNPFGGLPVLSTLSVVSAPVMWVIKNVFHDARNSRFWAAAATRCSTGSSRCASSCLRQPSRWSGRCSIAGGRTTSGCTSGSAFRAVCRGDDDGELRNGEVHSVADAGAAAHAPARAVRQLLADGRALVFDWRVLSVRARRRIWRGCWRPSCCSCR